MSKTPLILPPECFPGDPMRHTLYEAWHESASKFQFMLGIAADYYADWNCGDGHPDEIVCRAEWVPYGCSQPDPAHWWKWKVSLPAGLDFTWKESKLGRGARLNLKPWLCWPKNWVRVCNGITVGLKSWANARIDINKPMTHLIVTIGEKSWHYTPKTDLFGPMQFTRLFFPIVPHSENLVPGHVRDFTPSLFASEGVPS